MKHSVTARLSLLTLAACASAGCVLAEPADSFPFVPSFEVGPSGNNTSNNGVDMPPSPPPLLLFTEILIDAPGSDPLLTERGEYIEVKNIGEGPADPRNITMLLIDLDEPLIVNRIASQSGISNEEKAAYNRLEAIQPGEYFVFVRYEHPEHPISEIVGATHSYDYGRFTNGSTLPHQLSQRRRLELGYRYQNGDTEVFDRLQWEGHELRDVMGVGKPTTFAEGQALGVDAAFEHPDENDDPERWCVPDVQSGPVAGTPGAPTTCP